MRAPAVVARVRFATGVKRARLTERLRAARLPDGAYDRFFFVLGIGGSGTQWCAAAFTTERAHCFHEHSMRLNSGHKRDFSHFALLEDERQLDLAWRRSVVRRGAFSPMLRSMALRPEPRVGSADTFVGYFCDALHAERPSWPFLLVVRDGIKSVARFMRTLPWRGYQHFDRLWVPNWNELSDFERSCHRWRDRNRIVARRLEAVPESHRRIVTLETLTSDFAVLRETWEWLDLGDWDRYAERNRELQQTRVSRHRESPELKDAASLWAAWTPEQRETFERICGEDMLAYGFELPG